MPAQWREGHGMPRLRSSGAKRAGSVARRVHGVFAINRVRRPTLAQLNQPTPEEPTPGNAPWNKAFMKRRDIDARSKIVGGRAGQQRLSVA